MLKGYAVNQKRLEYLEKTVKLIDIAGRIDQKLKDDEAQEIIIYGNKIDEKYIFLKNYRKNRKKPKLKTIKNTFQFPALIFHL